MGPLTCTDGWGELRSWRVPEVPKHMVRRLYVLRLLNVGELFTVNGSWRAREVPKYRVYRPRRNIAVNIDHLSDEDPQFYVLAFSGIMTLLEDS